MRAAGSQGRAVVGVLANCGADGPLSTQVVDEKYITALQEVAGLAAVLIPAMGETGHLDAVLDRVDGLVLTGSVSNVHPALFAPEAEESAHAPFDRARDVAALHLIGRARERDVPLLAICRGFQELNVACGGTLRPDIQAAGENPAHPPLAKDRPLEAVYGPAHALHPRPGSWLAALGLPDPCVNSVHVQAVDRLGQGLRVDATAVDGTVEAVSLPENAFILGVQWHPEFEAGRNPISAPLFRLFGAAVERHRRRGARFSAVEGDLP